MKKIANGIVKYKFLILGVFIVLLIGSAIAFPFVSVNSDIIAYLPDEVTTTIGMDFMREVFSMEGDAIVGIDNVSYDEVSDYAKKIQAMHGVKKNGVIWMGTFEGMMGAFPDIPGMLPEGMDVEEIIQSIKNNPNVLKLFNPKENRYLLMVQMTVPTSSDEAMTILDNIEAMLANKEFAIGGSSQITKGIFDSTLGELDQYMIVAILIVIVILLLTTTSFIEPLILLLTLGASIIINIGTNIILPEVSVITFAASSILQLGVAMDYAIFLMHSYYDERRKTLDDYEALRRAIPKTFSTITSSAMTTVAGFLALFFMQFKIGGDLGIVLAKGVVLSLLTVLTLQPCLILLFRKSLQKTRHKIMVPKFNGIGSFAIKHKSIIIGVSLVLLVPAIIGQSMVSYSYMKLEKEGTEKSEMQQVVDVMGNSLIVIMPCNEDNITDHEEFVASIQGLTEVEAVSGIFSIMPENLFDYVPLLSQLGILDGFVNMHDKQYYTMYSIMLNVETESPEATAALKNVTSLTKVHFGSENVYITGMAQAVDDFSKTTPRDFSLVTIVSIIAIFLIVLLTFKNIKLSLVLIGVVQFGIFINLAITAFMKQEINFMGYIIISSIQMGATIDYAILYTSKYLANCKIMPRKQAVYRSLQESGLSVITSACIIAGACLSVYFICSNRIVGEITMLIARGAIISCILVLVLLPALMTVFGSINNIIKPKRRLKHKSDGSAACVAAQGAVSTTVPGLPADADVQTGDKAIDSGESK